MNPDFPAAHPVPAYRCFLPDLTGFTGRGCAGPGPMSAFTAKHMAERVGFEPTLGFPKHAFQACAFSRSATFPDHFLQQWGSCRETKKTDLYALSNEWRRGGDLNPRWSYPHNSFRDCRLQPLGHLSRCNRLTRVPAIRHSAPSFSKNSWTTARHSGSSTPGVMR